MSSGGALRPVAGAARELEAQFKAEVEKLVHSVLPGSSSVSRCSHSSEKHFIPAGTAQAHLRSRPLPPPMALTWCGLVWCQAL